MNFIKYLIIEETDNLDFFLLRIHEWCKIKDKTMSVEEAKKI